MRYSPTKHPGSGYNWVICDVCGKKVHQKDAIKIDDKFNTLNGMVVCKSDADKTNPQARPFRVKETLIENTDKLRPRQADQYVEIENDDRLPSAPRNLRVEASPLADGVDLYWQGPDDSGTSGIIGYVIARAQPQYAYHFVIEDDTQSNSPYYNDNTADITQQYTYKVAAINSFGTGPYSSEGEFPGYVVGDNKIYLTASQTHFTLTTGDGRAITIRGTA